MFTIVELSRTEAITNYLAPGLRPMNIASKLFYGLTNEDIADFWTTTFGVTEPIVEATNIIGVVYRNAISYSFKNSLSTSLNDNQSFFFDFAAQEINIHLNPTHQLDFILENMAYGVAFGASTDQVRIISNIEFLPLIKNFPMIDYSMDKFNYDKLDFAYGQIIYNNIGGAFNEFKSTPIYGNTVLIKTGEEGDEYIDLVLRRALYVEDYNFSIVDFIVDVQDQRKALSTQIPFKFFNTDDYPNIGDQSVGTPIPFGYGPLRDVPGYCINEKVVGASTDPVFIFLEILVGNSLLTDIEVWVQDADVWKLQTSGVTVDWVSGEVSIAGAKKLSGSSYDVLKVKANCFGIENTYASDVIKDLNQRFLGISYDTSGYDTAQWEAEEVYLSEIGLYINKVDDIFNYIRKLQASSSVGFKYDIIKGKRTIIIDNPNKDVSMSISSDDIFNLREVEAESNKDDMYNKIAIGYSPSIINDTSLRAENDSYFDISFKNYKITKVYAPVTGIIDATTAANRAKIQAEDLHLIRRVFELRLYGERYLELQLLDIIVAALDLVELIVEYITIVQGVRSAVDIVQGIQSSTNEIQGMPAPIVSTEKVTPYYGTIRGQIVSVKPDYDLKFNTIRLRERPYSTVWEEVYGD